MKSPLYIYQHREWPHFRWDDRALAPRLAQVRHAQGFLLGRMQSLGLGPEQEADLEARAQEALQTSEIEGVSLDARQVRSSLARQLGLPSAGLPKAEARVEGLVRLLLDATQGYALPLDEARVLKWHGLLFAGAPKGLRRVDVGAWRQDKYGPMQVVSGLPGHERVHFEAPPAKGLPAQLKMFFDWYNQEQGLDGVVKAALAHLWFVTLHPLDDGNGRLARAMADQSLARSEKSARRYYSMSAQIRREREDYYRVLEETQKGGLDISLWLEWFMGTLGRAIAGADQGYAQVFERARFWERHRAVELNARQRAMLQRLLQGFEGPLTSSKWASMCKCSQDTAFRDIEVLVREGLLNKAPSGGRSTHYFLKEEA